MVVIIFNAKVDDESLHTPYQFVQIRCVYGHNLTADRFHILNGNEQFDNFVSYVI